MEKRSNQVIDSRLTPVGEDQTRPLAAKIKSELAEGMPQPAVVFTSIAWRTCQTAVAVWGEVMGKEKLRAVHVSSSRLSKSHTPRKEDC